MRDRLRWPPRKQGTELLNRLFVIAGSLVVMVLAAALIAPWFINWTGYRADFEREASRIVGRSVTVKGEASARLLPFPSVTFTDVEVAGPDGAPPVMVAKRFSMDAELAPFLRGEILIFDMRLEEPKLALTSRADGTLDLALRPQAPAGVSQVTLESLKITNGAITLDHAASGTKHQLSEIDGEVSADTLAGPWRFHGRLALDGQAVALAASTGTPDADGQMRMRLVIEPERLPVTVETDGPAWLEAASPRYSGRFKIAPRNLEEGSARQAFAISVKETGTAKPAWTDLIVSGDFAADHQRLSFDTLRMESGPRDDPYVAEGSGFIDLGAEPRFELSARGNQVSLEEPGDAAGAKGLADRLAALQALLASVPRPAISGLVQLELPAVVAGDTTIRDLKLSARPEANGWAVDAFSAKLPGRTTLEASGMLTSAPSLGFDGKLLAAIAQPSGFAAWLGNEVDESVRRIGSAGFSAKVRLSPEEQDFSALELVLGGAKFAGSANRKGGAGETSFTAVKLEGGALDLDGLSAFAALFASREEGYRFGDDALDLSLKAGPVALAGITAETVDAAIRLRGARADIDRLLIGGLEGAHVTVAGHVAGTPAAPSADLDIAVTGDDLGPLARLGAEALPEGSLRDGILARIDGFPGLLDEGQVQMALGVETPEAANSVISLSAEGLAGGTQFTLSTGFDGNPQAPGAANLSFAFEGTNGDVGPLIALWGLPALPFEVGGAAETVLTLKGVPERGMDTEARLKGEDASLAFKGVATITQGLALTGTATASSTDFSPWLTAAAISLPGMDLGVSANLETPLTYGSGVLGLPALTGTVLDVPVKAALEARMAGSEEARRLKISGSMELGALDGPWLAALLLGEQAPADGAAWADDAFAEAPNAPADLDLELKAARMTLGSWPQASDVTARIALADGRLRLSGLTAALAGGKLTGLGELANSAGNGLFSADLRLEKAETSQLMAGPLAGKVSSAVSLSASGKSALAMASSLSGSGTLSFDALTVSGLNGNAFQPLLAKADALGREISDKAVQSFAPPLLRDGRLDLAAGEVAFTMAGGTLRTAPLRLPSGTAVLLAEVSGDASTMSAAVTGAVEFDPGDDALTGAEPVAEFVWSGKPGENEPQFDTEPLARFFTQRALEIEQARVEAMQAALMEKQRLRREVRYFAALDTERARLAEEARLKAEEEARLKVEEEARLKAEEEARLKAEAEEKAAAEAKAAAEEAARRKAEEEARKAETKPAPVEPEPSNAEETNSNSGLPAINPFAKGAVTIEDIIGSQRGIQ